MSSKDLAGVANARLRGKQGLWTVRIRDGRIASVSESGGVAPGVFDAQGKLLTESFANAHIHLDKVHTAERASPEALATYNRAGTEDAHKGISLAAEVKKHYRKEEIISRARRVVEEAVSFGCTHMRAFADTDTLAKLEGVRAVMSLRDEFKDRIEIQVVAFPQEGIDADPGAEEYVERALEGGADVVGGIPWLEAGKEAQQRHIDKMFDIAVKFNKPIAMLVDDARDPNLRTLEMLARRSIKEGWQGRVEACHARAMRVYPEGYARKVAKLCAEAGVGVVSNPHTGVLHTRIGLLKEAGVRVAIGQDDCSDAYYPFGRCNMLEVAFLAAHLLRRTMPAELEDMFDMVTKAPAGIMGIQGFDLKVGNEANLAVLDASDTANALARHSEPLLVAKAGRVVSHRNLTLA